jgi:hypothetical protein
MARNRISEPWIDDAQFKEAGFTDSQKELIKRIYRDIVSAVNDMMDTHEKEGHD